MNGGIGLAGLALLALAAAPAAAQTRGPPAAPDPVCIRIINTTDYWYPVQIGLYNKGEPQLFRVEGGEQRRFCVTIPLAPGDQFEVVLRSFMAPIGRCLLKAGGKAEIIRTKDDDGDPVNRLGCGPS
jgi:hypothetical protein